MVNLRQFGPDDYYYIVRFEKTEVQCLIPIELRLACQKINKRSPREVFWYLPDKDMFHVELHNIDGNTYDYYYVKFNI